MQNKQGAAGEGASETLEALPDYENEATELVEFALESLEPLYPSIKPIYTPEVRAKIALRTGRLMAKYNFTMGAFMGKWAEEVMFAVLIVPLISKTYVAIQHDNAAAQKATAAEPPVTKMSPIVEATAPDSLHTKL